MTCLQQSSWFSMKVVHHRVSSQPCFPTLFFFFSLFLILSLSPWSLASSSFPWRQTMHHVILIFPKLLSVDKALSKSKALHGLCFWESDPFPFALLPLPQVSNIHIETKKLRVDTWLSFSILAWYYPNRSELRITFGAERGWRQKERMGKEILRLITMVWVGYGSQTHGGVQILKTKFIVLTEWKLNPIMVVRRWAF